MAVNHLVFQGRLVAEPTFGQTNAGGDYANFRLAWSEKYKEKEAKCFLECKAFGGTAQFMSKYMRDKGQEIVAEGKLNTEEWEKDGQKRSKMVLVVNNVHFSGKKGDGGGSAAGSTADGSAESVQPNLTPVEVSDDLPF